MPASPRRLALTAALCLLGGAVASVVVAWGAALWSTVCFVDACYVHYDHGRVLPPPDLGHDLSELDARLIETVFGHLSTGLIFQEHSRGALIDDLVLRVMDPSTKGVGRKIVWSRRDYRVVRSGWPMTSMSCSLRSGGARWCDAIEPPVELLRRVYDAGPAAGGPTSRPPLPCLLMPLGFTLDTLFYAAILATLFLAPPRLRRSLRLRRGLCPACAYNLAGNATGICPECGRASGPAPV